MEGESNIASSTTILQNIDTNSQYQRDVHGAKFNICKRVFRSNRGLLQHLNTCRRKNNVITERNGFNVETSYINASRLTLQEDPGRFHWNNITRRIFQKDLDKAYEKIVYWRKNLFMLPS